MGQALETGCSILSSLRAAQLTLVSLRTSALTIFLHFKVGASIGLQAI